MPRRAGGAPAEPSGTAAEAHAATAAIIAELRTNMAMAGRCRREGSLALSFAGVSLILKISVTGIRRISIKTVFQKQFFSLVTACRSSPKT